MLVSGWADQMDKTSVLLLIVVSAYELPLAEGLKFERRIFHSSFATNDQKEGGSLNNPRALVHKTNFRIGMAAFAEKRRPNFTHS